MAATCLSVYYDISDRFERSELIGMLNLEKHRRLIRKIAQYGCEYYWNRAAAICLLDPGNKIDHRIIVNTAKSYTNEGYNGENDICVATSMLQRFRDLKVLIEIASDIRQDPKVRIIALKKLDPERDGNAIAKIVTRKVTIEYRSQYVYDQNVRIVAIRLLDPAIYRLALEQVALNPNEESYTLAAEDAQAYLGIPIAERPSAVHHFCPKC